MNNQKQNFFTKFINDFKNKQTKRKQESQQQYDLIIEKIKGEIVDYETRISELESEIQQSEAK